MDCPCRQQQGLSTEAVIFHSIYLNTYMYRYSSLTSCSVSTPVLVACVFKLMHFASELLVPQ